MSTCRPNFERQTGIDTPYPAYITAEEHGGKINLTTSWEYPNGTPRDVWNGIRMRWGIDSRLTELEIEKLKDALRPKIEKLFAMTEVEGEKRRFSEEASELDGEIGHEADTFQTEDFEPCGDENCQHCYPE